MANFPVFHGVRLAQNAFIQNAVVESLAANPTVLDSAGRLFFNETDRRLRTTTLTEGGQVVIATVAELTDIQGVQASVTQLLEDLAAASGSGLVGYAGKTEGDVTIAAGTVSEALDALVAAVEAAGQNAGDFEVRLASTDSDKGTSLVGYTGFATTNLTVAAGTLQASLNTIVQAISDAEVARAALETDVATNFLSKTSTTAQQVESAVTFEQGLVVRGDLTLEGNSFTIESETVTIADNIIELNSNFASGVPTEDAGVSVLRGDEGALTFVLWNETLDRVEIPVWDADANEGAGAFVYQGIASYEYVQEEAVNKINDLLTDLASVAEGKGAGLVAYAGFTAGDTTLASGTVDSALDGLVTISEALRVAGAANTTLVNAIVSSVGLEPNGSMAAFAGEYLTGTMTVRAALVALDSATDTVAQALAAEVTRAEDAEQGLANDIGGLALAVDSNLSDLVTQINGMVVTYDSPTPSTQHIIQHNLAASFIEVEAWVRDADNKYRKHIVFIEETDVNTVTIELTESRRIKVIVRAVEEVSVTPIAGD